MNNQLDNKELKVAGTPYEFYRTIRPEYFSDSYKEHKMSREMFKHILSTLSTDMKQDEFERFTCRLVGRLVTPNIIPPTGPNGGGDGKVDFETYVVDDNISCKWHVLEGCKGDERWAFAVSCKEKWEPKIISDVRNALSTSKGFNRFFFCTNQPISSKKKLEVQQKLKKEFDIETTIFDRDWYIDAVFEKGCYQVAIDALNLGHELDEIIKEGPLDKKRNIELLQVEERIQNHTTTPGIDTEYVADLLRAAKLSRELEHTPTEIRGRFYTAISEAKKYGLTQQLFEIHYQLGWTEFYWIENPVAMFEQYLILKEMLKQEVNPNRIERAFNLLNLLRTSTRIGLLTERDIDISKENDEWDDICQSIIEDPRLPATALYTKMLLVGDKLMHSIAEGKPIDELVHEFLDLINVSQKYIDIDVEGYSSLIETISPYVKNNPYFETLVDRIAVIQREKDGEASFAHTHYVRGLQNIKDEQYVSAVKHLGQSVVGFQQMPTMHYLIRTCNYLSYAFERLDLLHAAKVFLVRALSLSYHDASINGNLTQQPLAIYSELCRLELRQGQLNDFLNWFNQFIRLLETMPNYRDVETYEELERIDAVLSSLIIRSSVSQLPSQMPDVFKRNMLAISYDMLLYKLGYEEKTSDSFREIKNQVADWEDKWLNMLPVGYFLSPISTETSNSKLIKTVVKGCAIMMECDKELKSTAFATLLLALVESYFATADIKEVTFITSQIKVKIISCDERTKLEASKKSNEYRITINWNVTEDRQLDQIAINFLAHVLTRNSMHKDEKEYFAKKEEKEKIGERLCVMSNHVNDIENCMIRPYVKSLADWVNETDESYPMLSNEEPSITGDNLGVQSNHIITDLIDVPVWDKAKWKGCGYLTYLDHTQPPIMIFLYEEIEYGKQIFESWEDDFKNGKLRIHITIVTGVNKEHPAWYKVFVTPDLEEIMRDESIKQRYVMAASRFHLMQARSNENMQMFRSEFEKFKYAGITAAAIESNNQMTLDPSKRYPKVIPIRSISFREAWTIGENEIEMPVIQATDNPIIPEEHLEDAPVLKLLERKRQYV